VHNVSQNYRVHGQSFQLLLLRHWHFTR